MTEASVDNVVPYAYKSAVLKGKTDENLQSVRRPVLTTSNEDGTKTIILTVNEDVTLCGIGDVHDTLDCLTGEVVKRTYMLILPKGLTWRVNSMSETKWEFMAKISYDNKTIPTPSPSDTSLNTMMVNTMFDGAKRVSLADYSPNKDTLSIYVQYEPQNVPSHALTLDAFKNYVDTKSHTLIYKTKENSGKTVDLSIQDQNGKTLRVIKPIEGTMVLSTSSDTIKPLFSGEIPVEAITQNLASFIDLETEE